MWDYVRTHKLKFIGVLMVILFALSLAIWFWPRAGQVSSTLIIGDAKSGLKMEVPKGLYARRTLVQGDVTSHISFTLSDKTTDAIMDFELYKQNPKRLTDEMPQLGTSAFGGKAVWTIYSNKKQLNPETDIYQVTVAKHKDASSYIVVSLYDIDYYDSYEKLIQSIVKLNNY